MRRVREWICLILFRVVYPLSMLACCIVRVNGFSLMYGALGLASTFVRRPTPSSVSNATGTFLFLSMVYSGATMLAQAVFQVYTSVVVDPNLDDCSLLENVLRQIGLQKIGTSSSANATRLILPDVAALVASVFVYATCKALLRSESPVLGQPSESPDPQARGRLSKLMSQMVIFLGPGLVLGSMAMCGILAPSLVGSVYFVCFLLSITVWACGVQLGRWFSRIEGFLLVFNALHLVATYVVQMPFAQDLWNENHYNGKFHPNNTVLLERILGLKRLVYTNCSAPWQLNFYDDNVPTDYLNVAFLVVFFFFTSMEIRSTSEERKSKHLRALRSDEEDLVLQVTATDRDSLRSHPSPTRNYNTIEATGDDRPFRNEDWLSRRSSTAGSPSPNQGATGRESSRRFEAFKAVAVSIGQFILSQSYVGTLIVMMAWSITYHSWLAITFLLAACFIWMAPQKRKLCLRLSPLIVLYAECLLVISYIYGFKLTEAELPTRTAEGYDLSEIGFYKVACPFVRLVVQTLFLLVFLFTLKYSRITELDRQDSTSLDTLNALRRASVQATLQYNELVNQLGNWVMSFLTKYWILVCSLLFLIMALQEAVVYRILYMVMFLCFIISFQISYGFWRVWEKLFWVVVIIYSMVILLAIYTLQFKDIMEKVHNSTGMSYELMRDIGFEKYGTKDLFKNLLTPTSFLIVIILHLHYFQTKFLAISDVNRYRYLPDSTKSDSYEIPSLQTICGKTWKETLTRCVAFVHGHYRRLAVLAWRVLEVHLFKAVVMAIVAVCAVDVCCPNVVLLLAVLVLLPLGCGRVLSFIAMFFSSFVVVSRMVFQLQLVPENYFQANCTNGSSLFPTPVVNGLAYFGFRKSGSMIAEVQNYIVLVLLLAFEKIVSVHQEQHFNQPGRVRPSPGTLFAGVSRRHADHDLLSCLKFLANYGFYKFGKEISLLSVVIVMVARMDAMSLIHGSLLGLLFLLRRGTCRVVWPAYLVALVVLLFVQYLSCLGLPPVLCIEYPWNLEPIKGSFPENLKRFLFLPDYLNPPYSIKLIADFYLVLLVYLQLRVFRQEQRSEVADEGGSNENVVEFQFGTQVNPTEDFVMFKDSYLDYLKMFIFYYSYWLTLLLLFISGASRISLFCLGYLVGCFYFLWFGQDLLLKPIRVLNRIWSCMLFYCYSVLMVKCALQVVGCVYVDRVSCFVRQLLDITCILVPPYLPVSPGSNDNPESCRLAGDRMSLVWDCISFFSIFFLLRTYKSWYFQHILDELKVDNELASRGSELINEMTSKRVDSQKKFEANVLNSIRLKVERIRSHMQMQQNLNKAVTPYEDHYEVIRSGDYYMFEEQNYDPSSAPEFKEDDCPSAPTESSTRKDPKPPTIGEDEAMALFNAASVSGMEAAIAMWTSWQEQHGPGSTPDSTEGSLEEDGALVPADPGIGETSSTHSAQDKPKRTLLEKLKTFLKFTGIVCWSSVEQLIVFLNSISRDYVCISNNLKQEKLERKKAQSLAMRAQLEEPTLIELEMEGFPASPPTPPPPPPPSLPLQAKYQAGSGRDPILEERRFRKKMPLLLKLLYASFEVFLSHSELLCYFAMILNAIVYGSVLSVFFPLGAFLWATLSCPRPSKAFWLFAIGYAEVLILLKYVFQFVNYEQSKEPKNVFYWASVLGVTKEDYYAAFDIFLLMCLFFHRSVLKQHGLWRDAETAVPADQPPYRKSPTLSPVSDGSEESKQGLPLPPPSSSSSPTSTLRKRKVEKGEEKEGGMKEETDGDGEGDREGIDREQEEEKASGTDDDYIEDQLETNADDLNEYSDDFESEMSRICCHNVLVRSVLAYCRRLKDDTFRAAVDVYVFMFVVDIISFLIAIFGFSSFGPTDPSISGVMVTTVLKKNKIPSVLLGMLLVQFLFIILDRAIYLRKQVIIKLLFQAFQVLLIHAWVFFGLPYVTQKRFVENTAVQLWYFTKCIYLALSAYQIRCGYPTCILGNFLTKKYNYINLYCFQLFLVIPFLHELRSLMDWMFTDTTLALTSWLQMEDIYSNVFCVKCNRSAEKRYKTPRGNKRAALVKYGLGGAMLFLLVFIIWLPLLLFSMSNTIFEPNKPNEISITIKLAGYQKIFSSSAQELRQLTKADFDYIYSNFPATTRNFMNSYQENDCFNVTLKGVSESTWGITPPAMKDLVRSLRNDTAVVTVQYLVSARRNPFISAEAVSAQFERELTMAEDMQTRMELANLLERRSNSSVNISNVFPRHLVIPATGSVVSADSYFPSRDEIHGQLSGNLRLQLSRESQVQWWSVSEYHANETRPAQEDFSMTTFNERVAPSGVLTVLNNYGVFGLYISFVLVISRFLRMYIQGLSYKIMYVELPDPQALLTLCQDIYMVRESREFRLEEELFAQLIFLYRSPETLFKVTKQKSE